jgi:site-specific DNA-methyltransferase (adenine-specific)
LASGLEDAGFEIIGGLAWIYATGQTKKDHLRTAYEPVVLSRKTPNQKSLSDTFSREGRGLMHAREMSEEEGRYPANVMAIDEGTDELPNYFYCVKAPLKEKEYGCEDLPLRETNKLRSLKFVCDQCGLAEHRMSRVKNYPCPTCQTGTMTKPTGEDAYGYGRNTHPTVKPLALMRRIIRLTTRPGHTIIDPFMGSGSTGIAAVLEGRRFIGIEQDADFCHVAHHRIARALLDVGATEDAGVLRATARLQWEEA